MVSICVGSKIAIDFPRFENNIKPTIMCARPVVNAALLLITASQPVIEHFWYGIEEPTIPPDLFRPSIIVMRQVRPIDRNQTIFRCDCCFSSLRAFLPLPSPAVGLREKVNTFKRDLIFKQASSSSGGGMQGINNRPSDWSGRGEALTSHRTITPYEAVNANGSNHIIFQAWEKKNGKQITKIS